MKYTIILLLFSCALWSQEKYPFKYSAVFKPTSSSYKITYDSSATNSQKTIIFVSEYNGDSIGYFYKIKVKGNGIDTTIENTNMNNLYKTIISLKAGNYSLWFAGIDISMLNIENVIIKKDAQTNIIIKAGYTNDRLGATTIHSKRKLSVKELDKLNEDL